MFKHIIPAAFVVAASVGAAHAVAVNPGDTVCEGAISDLSFDGTCTTTLADLDGSQSLELNYTSGAAFLEGSLGGDAIPGDTSDSATLTGSGQYTIDLFAELSGSKLFFGSYSVIQGGSEIASGSLVPQSPSATASAAFDLNLGDVIVTVSVPSGGGFYEAIIQAQPVPVPAAGLLLLGGLGAMGALRRRKKAA